MTSPEKEKSGINHSLAIVLFIIGIAAIVATVAIFGVSSMPTPVLACEGLVLLCLIGLLIVVIRGKVKANALERKSKRQPYASVDKNEIDRIFDIIADEEKKRHRLDAFAAGVDLKTISEMEKSEQPSAETPSEPEAEEDEEKPLLLVIDDEKDEKQEDAPPAEE
ncbi:MAG: hypothetical protein IJP17_03570, partial [Clostridia bacterium]|nr:hypothetical protein [Clostridia bacterium]